MAGKTQERIKELELLLGMETEVKKEEKRLVKTARDHIKELKEREFKAYQALEIHDIHQARFKSLVEKLEVLKEEIPEEFKGKFQKMIDLLS